ncbi:DUF1444 domain-containing protein [Actinomadura barringtoniae]|uniref:DUF1444 domain-containing protein n=1 Tax=Actinomadura barringtoniae TaxID=1427535 RepID=A0A939PA92_9ACTN|nr:DUF1444 domain-containing protein [Actinomadura barringtoniae]MBO2445874.1 DUF1444 domain-containing protein [Actinomadura barringtoniae]
MTEPRASLIVPLMKARVPAEVQLEFPLPPAEEPIRDPFAGDLYVTYALELAEEQGALGSGALGPARRYEHIARRHCDEMDIPPQDLRRQAAINLRNRRPDLTYSWYPDVRAVTVSLGEGLESGLLLDDGFLDKLAQDVEGDLVVAAPARDVFVASGTGHPDGVDRLRWAVGQVWSEEQPAEGSDPSFDVSAGNLLTRDLLVRRNGAWEVLAAA